MGLLFTKLFQYLLDLLHWAVVAVLNLFVDMINALIVLLAAVLQGMLSILPSADFSITVPAALSSIINHVAWFIPISTMASCVGLYAVAIAGYFAVRPVLKFCQLT